MQGRLAEHKGEPEWHKGVANRAAEAIRPKLVGKRMGVRLRESNAAGYDHLEQGFARLSAAGRLPDAVWR